MLAIETAEIGCTLIALSIPGLKPLLGRWFEVFNNSAVPKSHGSGPLRTFGSLPSRKTKGATKLESGEEESMKRVNIRNRELGPGESDDSLVGKGNDAIQVRVSLHVDSNSAAGSDIKLDMYPRNWEH